MRPGHKRMLQYVESSPADQVQPKYYSIEYAKPGDALAVPAPVLFDVIGRKQILIANGLFSNPFELSRAAWRKDNRAFTFEYNQRGHQVYRVIEVDAASGAARAVVDEQCPTFFCYSGKKFRADLADGKEVVWMSERDGDFNHDVQYSSDMRYYLDGNSVWTLGVRLGRYIGVVLEVLQIADERRRPASVVDGRDVIPSDRAATWPRFSLPISLSTLPSISRSLLPGRPASTLHPAARAGGSGLSVVRPQRTTAPALGRTMEPPDFHPI